MTLSSKALVVIRNCVVFGAMIIGAVIWFTLPGQTIVHLAPQEVGSKMLLLVLLILPLFALIPRGDLPEFHTDSEENASELEKAKKNNAEIQLALAVVLAVAELGSFALLLAML